MRDGVPYEHPWAEARIQSAADVFVGGTPSTAVQGYWGGDVPWMSSGDVNLKRIHDVPGRITEAGFRASNAKLVEPPAVAVALAGQGKTRGTVALTHLPLCTNQSVALIKPRDQSLDASYLFHNLDFRYEELRSRSAGGGRAGLTKALIEAVPIPLPDAPEQHRIAAILDTLDDSIHQTRALVDKLRAMRAGLLHDLLTRGLDEQGRLRDPKKHPEQFKDSWLGLIPLEWRVSLLDGLLDRIEYGISVPLHDTGDIPVLRMMNLQNGAIDLSDLRYSNSSQARALLLRDGDILFNRTNSLLHVGRTALWRSELLIASFASYCVRLVVKPALILPEYLVRFMNLPEVQSAIKCIATPAVQQVNVNPTQLRRKLWVAYPSCLDEQAAIGERLALLDARIRAEEVQLAKLEALKRGLMDDLLTGQVRTLASAQEGL